MTNNLVEEPIDIGETKGREAFSRCETMQGGRP